MAAFRGNGKKFQEIPLRFKYHSGAAVVCAYQVPVTGSICKMLLGSHASMFRANRTKRAEVFRRMFRGGPLRS